MSISRRKFLTYCAAMPALTFSTTSFANWNGRYLVLVELKGANDGLNTLAPYESDDYFKLRPKIGLRRNDVIPVGESPVVGPLGLQNSLKGAERVLEEDLAILQGVGYPNQNRSHFKSIAIWETGGDGNQSRTSGWLVDSLERLYGPSDVAAHGASLEGSLGLFSRGSGSYVSMSRLNQLKDIKTDMTSATRNKLMQKIVSKKNNLANASAQLDKKLSSFSSASLPVRMPHGDFGGQLTDVLRVIGSDTGLPVMHVQHGSFDTHEGQKWRHPRLLKDLAEGLGAFRQNLIKMDRWNDVLVMTYSEFGRRAAENGAEGTDHGTASVQFVVGGRVQPGLFGDYPDLGKLVDGDLVHTLDYRALYEQVCSKWLGDAQNAWRAYQDNRLTGLLKTSA